MNIGLRLWAWVQFGLADYWLIPLVKLSLFDFLFLGSEGGGFSMGAYFRGLLGFTRSLP